MTKRLSPTTLPPSADPVTKAPRAKVVLTTVEDVEAQETHDTLPPASRLDNVTTAKKEKAIPTAHTTKAKAKTTLPPATLAIANPNSTLALTVVAPVTTLAIASNALLMRKQHQQRSNKQIKTL